VFVIFRQAFPGVNVWLQIWEYLESTTFKILTVSIIIPILLLLLESHFKIGDTVVKNRLERIRKEREQNRERRLECIKLTSQIFMQICDLAYEVTYNQQITNKEAVTEDVLRKASCIIIPAEETVSMWYYRFNLGLEFQTPSVFFFNLLIQCTGSVAYYIGECDNEKECENLRNSLSIITGCIRDLTHQTLLNILKTKMELLEGLEDTERLTDETAKLEEKVESHLAKLNGWAKNIAGIQKQYEQVLPIGKGKQFDNFRSEMKKLEEWLRGNPEKWPRDYKDLPEVTKSFYDIPHEEYVRTERVKYSAEFIKYLADWLGLESQYLEVMETSKW
jgi:hypothetical protein